MSNFITAPIDQYKVVLYGEDQNDGNLVAFIYCYNKGGIHINAQGTGRRRG